MNRIKQHSSLWYSIKARYLGANDCASILGHGFDTINEIIDVKVKITNEKVLKTPCQEARMARGRFYENYVKSEYSKRHGIKIYDTGLKFHSVEKLKFLTASPDGYYNNPEGHKTLMEFKVLHKLNSKVPFKYWIQMQIQMSVWNIKQCMYCENVVNKDGKLVLWNEQLINEDKEWFKSVENTIIETWEKIEYLRSLNKRGQKRKACVDLTLNLNEKITIPAVLPHMITNYIRKDPLLDWFNKYKTEEDKDLNENALLPMLKKQRDEFSSLIINHLFKEHGNLIYNVDLSNYPSNTEIQADQLKITADAISRTRIAMQEQVPIILNACLSSNVLFNGSENPIGNTGGLVNMLVLNSYLNNVLNVNVNSSDLENKYSIVMFKYATLDLKVDGKTLLNNDKQRVYKAQLTMLNEALSVEQNHIADCSYIIGRKYTWKGCKINSVFEHVAVVENFKDENYNKAIEWIVRLHTDLSMKDLNPGCLNEVNLFPNMKNHADYPWHNLKSKIASDIKEITLMYNCGHRVRELAHEKGITEWQNLTPELLKSNLSKAFLKAQQPQSKDKIKCKIHIPSGQEDDQYKLRFYIDFESIGNAYDDFSTFPVFKNHAMIFLIGVVVENTQTNELKYLHYIADNLTHDCELEIINNMFEDFKKLMKEENQTEMPLYHWSNAEKYLLGNAIKDIPENVVFIDLCKIFKDEQIIFHGQFNYGLKEIARVMKEENMIETAWPDTTISNGVDAMVEAIKIYKDKVPIDEKKEFFSNIVSYNYVDCKVMQEIVKWAES